jgi:hypothetical protein
MEDGKKQENYTGISTFGTMENGGESLQPTYTDPSNELPVLTSAHSQEESKISTGGVSLTRENLPAIMALMVIAGDYREVKNRLPESTMIAENGKVNICLDMPGHVLSTDGRNIYIDGQSIGTLLGVLVPPKNYRHRVEKTTGVE